MGAYVAKRLLAMIPTLLGVAVLIFVLLRVVPGDVVEARYLTQGSQFQSQELMNLERKKLGLDQPIWNQFTTWMGGVLRLDFGLSMWTGSPITEEIRLRFALSLQLALMATIVATLPYIWLPGFLVPLALTLHAASLRTLLGRGSSQEAT